MKTKRQLKERCISSDTGKDNDHTQEIKRDSSESPAGHEVITLCCVIHLKHNNETLNSFN